MQPQVELFLVEPLHRCEIKPLARPSQTAQESVASMVAEDGLVINCEPHQLQSHRAHPLFAIPSRTQESAGKVLFVNDDVSRTIWKMVYTGK